jgi:anti-sigma-K factor RskA
MSAGTEQDDDDALAAEVALRLLSPAELAAAEARIAADPAFRARVADWQERLADLAGGVDAVPPPARVKAGIERRLFPAPRRASFLWGLLAGGAVAAVLAVVVLLPLRDGVSPGPSLTASVAAEDGSLVFAARVEGDALRIERRAGAARDGRALELWLIAGTDAPVSLGVLSSAADTRVPLSPLLSAALVPGVVLAVSDEPPGGSPTGAPTGAVLAVGTVTAG